MLSVRGDGPTRISGLTIRNGNAQIHGGGGGGIAIDGSAVALTHVTVTNNAADQGDFPDGVGGGIEDVGVDGAVNLTLTDVRITGNQAYFGGGISVELGGATMSHVEISGNTAETSGGDGFGGGLYSVDSLTTIADSVIRNNLGPRRRWWARQRHREPTMRTGCCG